jgi:ATP-dependent exoDNAse (exonuclease V) beta subunit
LERAFRLVAEGLKNALSDERGRWVLGPHKMARNEYRLRSRVRSFRIDRYFEDSAGKKWVVDYKASAHEGAAVEEFLDEQQERYAAQLNTYAEALGGAERGLYFPVQKGWRSW